MSEKTLSSTVRRDTGWHRDGKAKGVYWRRRASGSKSWGYFADGKINGASSRPSGARRQGSSRPSEVRWTPGARHEDANP
jgi:hypothetical protein